MLSDSPPARDMKWTDAGIEGAWRYLNRLWRMVADTPTGVGNLPSLEAMDYARQSPWSKPRTKPRRR